MRQKTILNKTLCAVRSALCNRSSAPCALRYALILAIVLGATSCSTKKHITYLQNLDVGQSEYFEMRRPDYKLNDRDILYIRTYTTDEKWVEFLNPTQNMRTSMGGSGDASMYIYYYTIDDGGDVTLPLVGKVPVKGLTITQARDTIQAYTDKVLRNTQVITKLLSFKFTVIGEVSRPGTYTNYNNHLTVLEAIGMAGDLTDFADRKEVLVIRPTDSGNQTYRLNLKDKDLLTSEGYFLLPNDIVIVEPTNQKIFNLNIPTFTLGMTTISTLILILNFIKFN